MNFITDPILIEEQSMTLIRKGLKRCWQEEELPIVERIIHTSGDPSLEESLVIHPQAVEAGLLALSRGAKVISDVEMVRTGISKGLLGSFGGKAECFLNTEEVALKSKEWGLTRSMTAIRLYAHELRGNIVAIGNAPTALFELLRLAQSPETRPALIIGMPVGFIGAAESKEELLAYQDLPSIIIRGTRGGSPLAATSVNALLRIALRRKG